MVILMSEGFGPWQGIYIQGNDYDKVHDMLIWNTFCEMPLETNADFCNKKMGLIKLVLDFHILGGFTVA